MERLCREAFRGLYSYSSLMDTVFEDDVCVDSSGVLDWRPNFANITFSGLFVRPCTSRSEVIDKGPDYVANLLSGFYARARCPVGALQRCNSQGVWLREGEPLSKASLENHKAKRLWRAFKQNVSGEPSSKASLESLQVKCFWRAIKQGFSVQPSSKASLESHQAKRLWRAFKQSVSDSSFYSTVFLFLCYLTISMVQLLRHLCNGSI